MAKGESTSRGRIEVEFVADMTNVAAGAAGLQEGTQEVRAGGRDVARSAKGTKKDVQVEATADVKLSSQSKAKLNRDVQAAINGDTDTSIKLQIDTQDLRRQIENFFVSKFTIRLDPQIAGQQGTRGGAIVMGATPAAQARDVAPAGRGTPPDDLRKLGSRFGEVIDDLHDQLRAAIPTFQGAQGQSPFDKMASILQTFDANKFEDLLKVKTGGGFPAAVGGALSAANLQAQGVSPELAHNVEEAVRGLTGVTKEGAYTAREAGVLVARTRKWMDSTPMVAQAAYAPEPTAAQPQAPATTAAIAETMAARDQQLKEARQAVIDERQRSFTFTPVGTPPETGPISRRRGSRATSAGPGFYDEDAERGARTLGNDRANVRRLRGLGPVVNGISTEAYLRQAEMGRFQNVYEQFGGKGAQESQGFGTLSSDTDEGQAELERLAKLKPGIKRTITGKQGKFLRLSPTDAMIRTILREQGLEGDPNAYEQFRGAFDESADVKKAIAQGARPKYGTSGETKRGQGGAGIASVGSADPRARLAQFDRNIEVAETRITRLTDRLDGINRALESATKSRDTARIPELEQASRKVSSQIQRLDSGLVQAMKDRAELVETAMPSDVRRQTRGERALLSSISKENVASGAGLTPAERRLRELQSPESQGRNARGLLSLLSENGQEVTPELIQQALMQRYLENASRPEGQTGRRTLRQAAFGATGKARRNFNEGEDAGIYGEIMGSAGDLSIENRRDLGRGLSDMLSSLIEDEGFKRDMAEKAQNAREGAVRGVLPAKTTASAIVTDEGIQRVAFDRPGTGEGMFMGPGPGQAGTVAALMERNRRIKAGLEDMPPKGSEYPYVDPEGNDLADSSGGVGPSSPASRRAAAEARVTAMVAERQRADLTRQRTLGRGKYLTGDQAAQISRDAGVAMAAEEGGPTRAPLAGFYDKYAGGGGASGGGGGGAGGSGGGRWEVTGPIHVIVDNVPLQVSFAGSGGGGGGGGRRRGRVVDDVQSFSPEEEEEARPVRRGTSRRLSAVERATEADFLAAFKGANDPRDAARTADAPFAAASFLARGRERITRLQAQQQRAAEAAQRRASRFERVANPESLASETDISDEELSPIRARLRSVQRRVPRRGFGASLTDLLTSAIGGSAFENQLEKVGRAEREAAELTQLTGQRSRTRVDLAGLQAQRERLAPGQRGPIDERIGALQKQLGGLNTAIDLSTKKFFENADEAGKASTVFKSFAAAGIGSIGSIGIGALTFGLGSAIAAPVITAVSEGLAQGLGPAIERATGFSGTTARVTSGFADTIRGRGGDVGAVAGAAAQTGISGESFARISPLITQRADVEAGNKALQDQLELLHAFENLRRDQQGKTFDKGISSTTGGLFGTQLFGIPSTAELIGNELIKSPTQGEIQAAPDHELSLREKQYRTQLGTTNKSVSELNSQLGVAVSRLDFFNDAAKKGGESLLRLTPATDEQAEASAKLAESVGLFDFAGKLRETNTQVAGAQSGLDIQRFLAAANRGATTPASELLLQDTARARQAQLEKENANLQLQLQVTQPQTQGIGLGEQGFGAGGPTGEAGVDAGADRRITNAGLTQTRDLYKQINDEAQQGMDAAKSFVTEQLGSTAGADFAKSLDSAADFAKQISDIQIDITTKQAAYQAAQFNYQLSLAKRNLKDAQGLLSGTGNSLGALERQMFDLQREAQALSLAHSQNQINFQKEVAGFTAPGLTGEERAARIKQAKIEADYAQKQLDIQKQLFGLQGKQFTITASRNVQDLVRQISLLEQGRAVTLDTAAAEKRIKALTILQEKENKKVEAYYAAATQRANDIIDLVFDLRAATGEALTDITSKVLKTFGTYFKGMIGIINSYSPGGGGEVDHGNSSKPVPQATGGLHDVSSATQFVIGEAGNETVAVLRNPRQFMGGFGGGGGGVTVIVQGNKFNTQEEQDKLVRDITDAVTTAQARKLALTGLRSDA